MSPSMNKTKTIDNILYDDDVSVLTFDEGVGYPSSLHACKEDLFNVDTPSQPSYLASSEDENSVPSIDEMIFKLSESMMRSARSREMLSKTVFSQMKMTSFTTTTSKPRAHKARRVSSVSKFSIDTSGRDNSVCGFLRASKKW